MLVRLVGEGSELESLAQVVSESLRELSLTDIVPVERTNDPEYKIALGITQNPALCVEEERIDFRDMMFEGTVPSQTEISHMFVSIVGGEEPSSCSTGDGCGTCGGGCAH